jgi:hypothetical protein
MTCETCPTKDFVHADLYCHGCKEKPIVTGIAYLFQKDKSEPRGSVSIEAPEGQEYLYAAHELMQKYRIEFMGDEG